MFSAERIQSILEEKLPECTALVNDDANDGEHFSARVVSAGVVGSAFFLFATFSGLGYSGIVIISIFSAASSNGKRKSQNE